MYFVVLTFLASPVRMAMLSQNSLLRSYHFLLLQATQMLVLEMLVLETEALPVLGEAISPSRQSESAISSQAGESPVETRLLET